MSGQYTLADLQAINRAIASGELSIQRNGVRVEYRSMADLKTARQLIIGDLQAQGLLPSAANVPRTTYAAFSRE